MCKIQCLLAVVALSSTYVHAWDIALTTGSQLEFYSNGTKTHSEGAQFRDLTALAYDAVYNMLLFVDRQSDNASIFSYHLAAKKYQSLVRRKPSENIQGLTFDPISGLVFWTDTFENGIFWISLKPGSKNDVHGNVLFKMHDRIPRDIAVDSCRGYVYWTNIVRPSIERCKFDGSDREVIVSSDIFMPVSITLDQRTKKIYWADDREGIHYSIESADLDGQNREKLFAGTYHEPNALTVSKDSIYWVDLAYKSVWQLPKKPGPNEEPKQIVSFLDNVVPFGIVANYTIEDQTEGIAECKALLDLSHNKTEINDSFNIPADVGLFCIHGTKLSGKLQCECTPGYTGERCDVSVCHNFCIQGNCSVTADGEPTCSCEEGSFGTRCEITKCEMEKDLTVSTEPPAVDAAQNCNCSTAENASVAVPVNQKAPFSEIDDVVTTCDGWDAVRDPIIMMLAILCGLLCLACALLITKILHLKRRPRIKKRIIVNKNVTPMTARPDQCEITIENCCNMNICETPCFEPRSTIRPKLLDAKPGKEENRNLIANMELPEDY